MVTILKGLCQPPAPIKSFIQSGPFEFWRGHGPHHPKLKHPTRNMDWATWISPSSVSNSPPVAWSWTERTVVSFLSDRGEYHIWPGMAPMFPREPGWMRELDSCKSHPAPSFPAGDIELSSASAVGNTSLIMRNEQRGGHQGRIARTPLDVWEAVFRTPPVPCLNRRNLVLFSSSAHEPTWSTICFFLESVS